MLARGSSPLRNKNEKCCERGEMRADEQCQGTSHTHRFYSAEWVRLPTPLPARRFLPPLGNASERGLCGRIIADGFRAYLFVIWGSRKYRHLLHWHAGGFLFFGRLQCI